jgi:hypothetical protein
MDSAHRLSWSLRSAGPVDGAAHGQRVNGGRGHRREEAERRLANVRSADEQQTASGRSSMRRWDRSSKQLLRDTRRFTLTIRSDRLDMFQVAQIVHLAAQSMAPGPDLAPRPVAASVPKTGQP